MTVYYFAAETGNDANNGLSTGAPKQTPTAAAALVLAGNEIRWKCGERWAITGTQGWSISDKALESECRVHYYNDDVSPYKPMFDGGTYLTSSDDANWTHIGGGVWTRSALSATVSRVFAGTTIASVRAGSWGQAMEKEPVIGDLNATLEYFVDSSFVLSIYTGSTTIAPPTFYDGLCLLGNGRASSGGIIMRRNHNVTLEGLQVVNANQCFDVLTDGTRDSLNIKLIDCEAHAISRSGNGFLIENASTNSFTVKNTQLIRCIADNHSSTSENDGTTSNWGSNNGIHFWGNVQGSQVVDPVIRGGFRHTMLQAQSQGKTTIFEIKGLHVYRTRSDMGILYSEADYEHPIDFFGDGWIISDIEVRSPITRSQFGGIGTIKGVLFNGGREAVTSSGTDQIISIENWDDTDDYKSVKDITIESCIFVNPFGTPIHIHEDRNAHGRGGALFEQGVKAYNNLIIDLSPGGGRTYSFNHHVSGTPHVCSTDRLQNNIFVTALTTPIRHEESAGVFTQRDVNTTAGSVVAVTNLRASSVSNAGLTTTYYPVEGGVSDGTGTHSTYRHDINGVMYHNPPPKGPKERLR